MNNKFFDVYQYTVLKDKRTKLTNSFDSTLYSDFFSHYRTTDPYGSFTDGASAYNLHNFPTYFYEKQKELYRLQALRDSELKRIDAGSDELQKAQEEVDQAKQAVKDKEGEIQEKIAEKIETIRSKIKTDFPNHGLGKGETYKGFDKTSSEDNRIDYSQMITLPRTLK
jgi:hypothetical protein